MSRRTSVAAPADARPVGHSRRSVIAGAASSPLLATSVSARLDQCVEACENWLSLNAEHDRLARRWAKLEAKLAREHNFLKLTDEQRRELPQARELFVIDERIEEVYPEREALLTILPALKATSAFGLAGKLAVATLEVRREDNEEAHWLIASILRDLKAMCPELMR